MTAAGNRRTHWRRYRILYLLLAAMLAPVAASYLMYYVIRPEGRTNYGALIEPQRAVPALPATSLDGTAFAFGDLRGRWVLVMADGGACDARCEAKLLQMRQQRAMTGKDRDRIERVWLIIDAEPLSTMLMREYEGTLFVRVDGAPWRSVLQLPAEGTADLRDHIWVVDPFGHLMMRWPRNPDPARVKRDIARLLKASDVWVHVDRKDRPGDR
jgi:hypothetical protein